MAEPETVTLDVIVERSPKGIEKLNKIIQLAEDILPHGWKEWKISIEYAEEGDLSLEAMTFSKLRFILPTTSLIKIFYPNTWAVSEKCYKTMKAEMVRWPVCRAFIIGPPEVSRRIRGSTLQHELVVQSTWSLRPLIISREEAISRLKADLEEDDVEVSTDESEKENLKRKRKLSTTSQSSNSKKTRLDNLESRQARIESLLVRLVKDSDEKEDSEELSSEEEDDDQVPDQTEWKPPSLKWEEARSFDFAPQIKEQEPAIPNPLPDIKDTGMQCQRLGTSSWNKIRYIDAQKKIHANGVFNKLQVNHQLHQPVGVLSETLEKMDASFGFICHGLLMQRKAFKETLQDIATKYPNTKSEIIENFTGDSSKFKNFSDELLQFVCGKRAEILEARRKLLEPTNRQAAQVLRTIPPSESHLFDDSQLKDAFARDSYFRDAFRRNSNKKPFTSRNWDNIGRPSFKHSKTTRQRSQHPKKYIRPKEDKKRVSEKGERAKRRRV